MDSKVRLHITGPLGAGQPAALTREQAHYLSGVMRLAPGDTITVFDGATGAWRARIATASRRGGHVEVEERVAPQRDPPDLWLLFAPIKKARTDFIVEKAAELGASRILPVSTRHTNSERIRRDRLQAHAVEAAEQCGGTFVPEVAEIVALGALLDAWPEDRALVFCDEALSGDAKWGESNVGQLQDGGGLSLEKPAAETAPPEAAPNVRQLAEGYAGNGLEIDSGALSVGDPANVRHLTAPPDLDPDRSAVRTAGAYPGSTVGHSAPFLPSAPAAILIGPEGGFSGAERARLHAMPQTTAISLGPRILRADTAAVAALTLWQAVRGDWG